MPGGLERRAALIATAKDLGMATMLSRSLPHAGRPEEDAEPQLALPEPAEPPTDAQPISDLDALGDIPGFMRRDAK